MNRIFILILAVLAITVLSCNKYLDLKPDIKMAIPNTLEDANLLLNDYTNLNGGYPIWGEIGTDDYYLTKERWESASNVEQRNAYLWADEPYLDVVQWQRPYKTVYIANQVLNVLSKLNPAENTNEYKRLTGGAFFYRAFALQQLVAVHCAAYVQSQAANEQGLPLRSSPNLDEVFKRSSLQETYAQIIADFTKAAVNLPEMEAVKGRPSKAAAYAALARVNLDMGDFAKAYLFADSCLRLSPELLDYNSLKITDALPIPRFNVEVLFPALSVNLGILGATNALIDTSLYQSYDANDLRKSIFFRSNANPSGSFYFKGSYDKNAATMFVGITTSEIYLVKAEAACRIGKVTEALSALNTLLKMRWNKNVPVDIKESDPDKLLKIILDERRRELVFRGRRWADLKRLNLDLRFRKTLERRIGNEVYKLNPNSTRYAFRLAEPVIIIGGLDQNKR